MGRILQGCIGWRREDIDNNMQRDSYSFQACVCVCVGRQSIQKICRLTVIIQMLGHLKSIVVARDHKSDTGGNQLGFVFSTQNDC